jgi:hypothetical protein
MPRKNVVNVKPTSDAEVSRPAVTRGKAGVYMLVANGGTALYRASVRISAVVTVAVRQFICWCRRAHKSGEGSRQRNFRCRYQTQAKLRQLDQVRLTIGGVRVLLGQTGCLDLVHNLARPPNASGIEIKRSSSSHSVSFRYR